MTLYVCTRDMCNAGTITIEHRSWKVTEGPFSFHGPVHLCEPPQGKEADAVLQVDKKDYSPTRNPLKLIFGMPSLSALYFATASARFGT